MLGDCMKPYVAMTRWKPWPSFSSARLCSSFTSGIPFVTTLRITTVSCSILLCLRWCSSTTGTPPTLDVMNTAVPRTRR